MPAFFFRSPSRDRSVGSVRLSEALGVDLQRGLCSSVGSAEIRKLRQAATSETMGRSNPVSEGLQIARSSINQTFASTEPWKLILFTAVAAWGVKALSDARYGDICMWRS